MRVVNLFRLFARGNAPGLVLAIVGAAMTTWERCTECHEVTHWPDCHTCPSDRMPPEICAGCGDMNPAHWREGGWYCESCASCEVCLSPYCDEEEHRS